MSVCAATLIVGNVVLRAEEKQPATEATAAPAKLTKQEQAEVDRAVDSWKQATKKIERYECSYTRWFYDSVYLPPKAPGQEQKSWIVAHGEFKYAAPDKWSHKETALWTWEIDRPTQQLKPVKKDHGEHWARDGNTIYQVDDGRQVVEKTLIPPKAELGQGWLGGLADALIVPPRIFGVSTDYFQEGYDVRIITPKDTKEEIWLESVPRRKGRTAPFEKAEVILRKKDMLPSAIRISTSAYCSEVYEFENPECNDQVKPFGPDTFAPNPNGYKVVEPPGLFVFPKDQDAKP